MFHWYLGPTDIGLLHNYANVNNPNSDLAAMVDPDKYVMERATLNERKAKIG